MTGSLRGSSARLAALAVGLLLTVAVALSGAAPPGAAVPGVVLPGVAVPGAATAHCPKPHVTYSDAQGETTQFGWLLAPGSNGANQRDVLQYNVVGGQVICDSVTLSNSSEQAITVQLYPADAYNIADGGAFAFTAFKDKPKGVGTWITLPVTRVKVPAGRAANIPIVVRVPTDVNPGDVAGGVVARDTKVRQGESVGNVNVGVRAGVGVRLYAQVAGLLHPKLSLTKLSLHLEGGFKGSIHAGSATVSYQVANSGNVRLSPQSTGTLKTRTRTFPLATHQFNELLPGSKPKVVTEKVKGLGWGSLIGRVHAKVTVSAPGARPVTKEVTAWRTPWLSLIGAGGVIALMTGAGVIGLRRRTPTGLEPTAEERDRVTV